MIRDGRALVVQERLRVTGSRREVPARFAAAYGGYADSLEERALVDGTRRAYDSRVRSFLDWLDSAAITGPDPLADPHARDKAIRAYLAYLKETRQLSARTLNAHLTALYHFYDYLGLGSVRLRQQAVHARSPRPLDQGEQDRWLRAVLGRPARDRAIGLLLLRTGVLPSELSALNLDDVPVSDRAGKVVVRSAARSREIPLRDREARAGIAAWKAERQSWPGAGSTPALILNRHGGRPTPRAIGQLAADLAAEAGLVDEHGRPDASPRRIRITFAANLIRDGADPATVGELMGLQNAEAIGLSVRPGPAASASRIS
jgi:integrase/recombinase XerC